MCYNGPCSAPSHRKTFVGRMSNAVLDTKPTHEYNHKLVFHSGVASMEQMEGATSPLPKSTSLIRANPVRFSGGRWGLAGSYALQRTQV